MKAYAINGDHQEKSLDMIRVTSSRAAGKTIVQIHGDLRDDFVEELGRFVSRAEPPVTLDLSNLRSMDSDAADVLVKMAKDVAEVSGASPYIRILLGRHGLGLEE